MSQNREIDEFKDELLHERPRPTPAFRSEVRSSLLAGAKNRPPQLRALIFSYAAAGALLLAVAAFGVAGAGPLAA
ncbi:MAG: hypothetical protein QOD60_735 [Solirubrobacterales bacterium]|jgi:hypothetical protein|nr:hypothetical protein [Solirubrobacterales bacterium]